MQEKRGMNHSFHGYNLQHSNNCFKYSGYEYTPELLPPKQWAHSAVSSSGTSLLVNGILEIL